MKRLFLLFIVFLYTINCGGEKDDGTIEDNIPQNSSSTRITRFEFFYEFPNLEAYYVDSDDYYVYVGGGSDNQANVSIISLKDFPPIIVSQFNFNLSLTDKITGISYSNKYLFVSTTDTIYALDVSDPLNPKEVGRKTCSLNQSIKAIFGDYSIVYAITPDQIVTVSFMGDPPNPNILNTSSTSPFVNFALDLAGVLFIANGNDGITVYNVSNIIPSYIDKITTQYPVYKVNVGLFPEPSFCMAVANGEDGFSVYNIDDIKNPRLLFHVTPGGKVSDIIFTDNTSHQVVPYIFVANDTNGVLLIDLKGNILDKYDTNGKAMQLTFGYVNENLFVYVADYYSLVILRVLEYYQ